jgi:hypothetical protein
MIVLTSGRGEEDERERGGGKEIEIKVGVTRWFIEGYPQLALTSIEGSKPSSSPGKSTQFLRTCGLVIATVSPTVGLLSRSTP